MVNGQPQSARYGVLSYAGAALPSGNGLWRRAVLIFGTNMALAHALLVIIAIKMILNKHMPAWPGLPQKSSLKIGALKQPTLPSQLQMRVGA